MIVWVRALELRQGEACLRNARDMWFVAEIELEAFRIVELRQQHDLEEAGPVEQEIARSELRQPRFQWRECTRQPVAIPNVDLFLRMAERILEILQHRQVVHGVRLGCDRIGKLARGVAVFQIGWQQRVFRIGFIQPFDLRHGLGTVAPVSL